MKIFIKLLFSNLAKTKLLTILSFLGFIFSILSSGFIIFLLENELDYDNYNNNVGRIYRVTTTMNAAGSIQKTADGDALLGPLLKKEFPQIEETARFRFLPKSFAKTETNSDYETNFYLANNEVFKIFPFKFIEGNPQNALANPNSIVISRATKEKYFGNESAIGKIITIQNNHYQYLWTHDKTYNGVTVFKITGIFENIPKNSDLFFDGLISRNYDVPYEWLDETNCFTYILFRSGDIGNKFNVQLKQFVAKYYTPLFKSLGADFIKVNLELQPLKNLHFETPLVYDTPKGNKTLLYTFSGILSLITILFAVAFINFSINLGRKRLKEWKLKRILGENKIALQITLTLEPILIGIFCILFAIFLLILIFPIMKDFFSLEGASRIALIKSLITKQLFIVLLISIIAGLISSTYVINSFLRHSFKPQQNWSSRVLSKLFLITQLTFSLCLLTCTLCFNKQIAYITNKELGFQIKSTTVVQLPNDTTLLERIYNYKADLLSQSTVKDVALGGQGSQLNSNENLMQASIVNIDNKIFQTYVNKVEIDERYLDLFNIKLKLGRNFSAGRLEDKNYGIIINEAYAKVFKLANPLGHSFWEDPNLKIIGMIGNIHYKTLYNKTDPLILVFVKYPTNLFVSSTSEDGLKIAETIWKKDFPELDFRGYHLQTYYNQLYKPDVSASNILKYFSLLTLFLSCLNILITSLNLIENKRKEIGLKLILGASRFNIILKYFRDYNIFILAATIISIPISKYLLNKLFKHFTDRLSFSFSTYLSSTGILFLFEIVIIYLTVQLLSNMKPVDTLKNDR